MHHNMQQEGSDSQNGAAKYTSAKPEDSDRHQTPPNSSTESHGTDIQEETVQTQEDKKVEDPASKKLVIDQARIERF